MGGWASDVSVVFFVFFVIWVLWGVLQYGLSRESDERSEDPGNSDPQIERGWSKRPTLR